MTRGLFALGCGALALLIVAPVQAACVGDCNGNGAVTIDELVTLVDVGLNGGGVERCAVGDLDGDGTITINELVAAVGNALQGCPATPTATAEEATPSATATDTIAATATASPPATETATPIPASATPTHTAPASPTATGTAAATEPESTATATGSVPPTASPTASGSPTASATADPPTATASPTDVPPSATATAPPPTGSATATATAPLATATATASPTPPATASASGTPTQSGTPTRTPTFTGTASRTPTSSVTSTPTRSATPTRTDTPTRTATVSATPTRTLTPSPTASATRTETPTAPPTATATPGLGVRHFTLDPASSRLDFEPGLGSFTGFTGFLDLAVGVPDPSTGVAPVAVTGASPYLSVAVGDFTFCIKPLLPAQNAGVLSCNGGIELGVSSTQDHHLGTVGVDGFTAEDCAAAGGSVETAEEPHPGVCNGPIEIEPSSQVDSGAGALLIGADARFGSQGLPVEITFAFGPCTDHVAGASTVLGLVSAASRATIHDAGAIDGEVLEQDIAGENFSCAAWTQENGPGRLVFASPALHGAGAQDLITVIVLDD